MKGSTDWDAYYAKPYRTATYTRQVMGNKLVRLIEQYADTSRPLSITEIGGGNSCFYEPIREKIAPQVFTVIDNNELGLRKFLERTSGAAVRAEKADVLELKGGAKADVVFSVGLIEHFSVRDTARVIRAHFAAAKDGGLVIISFPTPTFLYRATRFVSEKLGLWIFHDERPLQMGEVLREVSTRGTVLFKTIVWSMVLTQGLIVVRKKME